MAINCNINFGTLERSLGEIHTALKQRNEIERDKLDVLKKIEKDLRKKSDR